MSCFDHHRIGSRAERAESGSRAVKATEQNARASRDPRSGSILITEGDEFVRYPRRG